MNKYKKVQIQKYKEATKNMSELEVAAYHKKLLLNYERKELLKELHALIFPEAFDFMCDSYSDMKLRRKGISPMSTEYLQQVNEKRKRLGVSELNNAGLEPDKSSFEHCENVIEDLSNEEICMLIWTIENECS